MSALSPYLQVVFSGFERGSLADPEAAGESWVYLGQARAAPAACVRISLLLVHGGAEKHARARGSAGRRLARLRAALRTHTLLQEGGLCGSRLQGETARGRPPSSLP